MGSFSFTCQLSGLPITSGNRAVIIPLFPKENWWDNSEKHLRKFGLSNFCSNDGENVFFDELFFPIFGEYNDYGSMENIIHDDNTKVIEEYFNLTIEEIVEVLTDGRRDEYPEGGQFCDSVNILKKDNPKHMMLLKTSCTWIHGDLYEKLSNFESKDKEWGKVDLGTDSLLTYLGFKRLSEKGTDPRYNIVYEKDGLKINSDGNWIHISSKAGIYDLKDFEKYCKKQGVDIDISKIDKMGMWEQIYELILPKLDNILGHDRWETERVISLLIGDQYKISDITFAKTSKHLKEAIQKIKDKAVLEGKEVDESVLKLEKEMNESALDREPELEVDENITVFYFKKIKENGIGFMKKNILDWHKVKGYYYPTGRYLYPIGTSPQDGDYRKVKEFIDITSEIINDIMKKRMEAGYEQNEDDDE